MKKVLSLSLVVILLLLFIAPATYAAPPAQGGGYGGGGYGDGGYGGGGYGGGGYGGGGGGGFHYTVNWGDTLFSIGRRFGVYPYYIAQVNGLHNPNWIYAGQVLWIPSGGGWGNCGNPCYGGGYYDQSGWQGGRDNYCGGGNPCYNQGGWGYDNAGYYYWNKNQGNDRYSYPCGYYSNCYSY
jgi:hypothetical protein